MPSLAKHLQKAFSDICPQGWTCQDEVTILSNELNRLLGYQSRADVLLSSVDNTQRVWIEFEISRADPVANHAKFATAHLFKPWSPSDTFISMVSPHVSRGRRNLAANTITLIRHLGIQAFQTPLFPYLDGSEIKRLNHLPFEDLQNAQLNIKGELDRAFAVAKPIVSAHKHLIHYVANYTDMMLNLHQWHEDLKESKLRNLWGKRTVTYFVYDPRTKRFAPSKFCAFMVKQTIHNALFSHMTMDQYVTFDESETRFDGHIARKHLEDHLAMRRVYLGTDSAIEQQFEKWLKRYSDVITLHPRGPIFLVPPTWFA
ncbi:MAG: hypothetical protein HOE48_24600 [Candidatus Latescibacteria bacterium]|nr:hypothetical protein [Candidatus Latescibacterota bacterium]